MLFKSTRFANIPSWTAYLVLIVLSIVVVHGLIEAYQAVPFRQETHGADGQLYRSIIEQVHAGENYYEVAGRELRSRGYATRPFFTWRLPLLAWFLGSMPRPIFGMWVLILLALVTLFLWIRVLEQEKDFFGVLAGSLLLCGPLLLSISKEGFLFHELWAGICIALSLAAHARRRWFLCGASGLLALFLRELALPYIIVMLLTAWRERQHREAMFWLAGLMAFGLFLAAHATIVSGLLTNADRPNTSWIQLGGWSFVLATAQWNTFLLAAPWWVVPVVLPLALLGLAGWRGAIGTRLALTVGAYVATYFVVGRSDNFYWGLMYAPLMSLGLLYTVPSLVDLWRTAACQSNRKITNGEIDVQKH
jgi:hypothetical protein